MDLNDEMKKIAEQPIRQESQRSNEQTLMDAARQKRTNEILKEKVEEGIKRENLPMEGGRSGSGIDGLDSLTTNTISSVLAKAKHDLKHKGPMDIRIGVNMPNGMVSIANEVQIQLVPEAKGSKRYTMLLMLKPGYIQDTNRRAVEMSQLRNAGMDPKLIKPKLVIPEKGLL